MSTVCPKSMESKQVSVILVEGLWAIEAGSFAIMGQISTGVLGNNMFPRLLHL